MKTNLRHPLSQAYGTVLPFVRAGSEIGEPQPDEAALVERAKESQRLAQHALYVRYYDTVRARIERLLGCSAEVDDVLQDTFVLAFRDLVQLQDATHFGGWLCGIAVHQVYRRLRRRQLLRRLGFRQVDEWTLAKAVDPAASPEVRVSVEQLERALHLIAPRQRMAWMLRHVDGCSLDEVARWCRCSLATAKRDLARAELHLQAQLSEHECP